MKATELRIGNLVSSETSVPKLFYWDIDDFEFYKHRMDDIEPIPLTEEWLVKFGFKLPAHSWIGDKFHLSEYGEGSKYPNGGVWVVAMNKNNAIISEIQYVHQLQNLYFALTGEELTIK